MKNLLKIIFFAVVICSCVSCAQNGKDNNNVQGLYNNHDNNVQRLHYGYSSLIKYCKKLYGSDKATLVNIKEIQPGVHGAAYANCAGDETIEALRCCLKEDQPYWTLNGNSCFGGAQSENHDCGLRSPVQ